MTSRRGAGETVRSLALVRLQVPVQAELAASTRPQRRFPVVQLSPRLWHAGTGKPALFFEGGQTPFWKRLPKRGFHNRFSFEYDNVLVAELDAYVRMGKLDPRNVITMKHMYDAGLLEKKAYNRNGVALLNKQPSAWKRARLEAAVGYALPDTLQYPLEVEVRSSGHTADQTRQGAEGALSGIQGRQD